MAVKLIPRSLKLILSCLVTASILGCGSDEPTPVTPEQFEEGRQKQIEIRRKEYGPGADKASGGSKAGKRRGPSDG